MEFLVRGKRDIKPLLLKVGVALALSFAGYLASHLRSRHLRKRSSGSGTESEASGKGFIDALRILKSTEESLAKAINGTSATTTTTKTTTFLGLSPTSKSSGDEESFLLPEFNDLVFRETNMAGWDLDTTPNSPTLTKSESREEIAMGQEILQLKNLVRSLTDRERNLELQLLEYYGLEEQEEAMRELESQVKINAMEARLFALKIDTLQAENQKLHAQLLDYTKAVNELEVARAKVKALKRKLKLEGEEAKEKMGVLQTRISALQDRVEMDEIDSEDIERKLKRLKELEDEAMDLKMANSRLTQENRELSKSLEDSLIEGSEIEALEEAKNLREANDKLTNEIEQLQTDRCADVEELVYLRWVNACLRYELRNYQPPPGKTVARDLSKTLSPKSEEKAKQLIIEYANSGIDDNRLNPGDSDIDYCSSSQASTGESDETSFNDSSSSVTKHSMSKSKFFKKLKKLVLGKDSSHHNKIPAPDRTPISYANSERRPSFSTYSVDEMIGRDSYGSFSSSMTEADLPSVNQLTGMEPQPEENQSKTHGRPSLDIQRFRRLKLDDESERKEYKIRRMGSFSERSVGLSQTSSIDSEGTESPEKAELKKFAEALMKSTNGMQRNSKRWMSPGK